MSFRRHIELLTHSAGRRLSRAATLAKFASRRTGEVDSSLDNAIAECQEAIELLQWAKDELQKVAG